MPGTVEQKKEIGPFRLNISYKTPLHEKLLSPSTRLLERVLFLEQVENVYETTLGRGYDGCFMQAFLDTMNVSYEVSGTDLDRFPKTGPAIAVANHPFGGIEAIVMCALLKSVRPDAMVMANYMLNRIPEVKDYCIYVDPFERSEARAANIAPIKKITKLLRNGGVLGVFPAGEVSHVSLKKKGVVDPPWNTTIAKLVRRTEVPVVPLYFDGHNGPVFQVAGMIHPRLRTAMLPRELVNKKNRQIKVSIGHPIPFAKLRDHSDTDMMDYLRFRTYVLANRDKARSRRKKKVEPVQKKRKKKDEPIAPPGDPKLMRAELKYLHEDQKLGSSGDMSVYVARPAQIRHILHEIGRLREVTFRKEGEGTGQATDLDRFDEHYLHLFMWNGKANEVVGAYRIGQTDEILASHGKRGLYTSTLFRYKKKLLNRIDPGLEMGRSFVRPEYQRSYTSLLMLWKGIGTFIVRNPKYTNLFGPVSISNEYASVSRRLLAMYLKANNYEDELSRMLKPKRPMRRKRVKGCAATVFDKAVKDLDTISNIISDLESDDKGVPILLKQYLRLGGKLLGFNIDPDFGHVLDGLILVDLVQLAKTDRKQMERFMGKDGYLKYVAWHEEGVSGE